MNRRSVRQAIAGFAVLLILASCDPGPRVQWTKYTGESFDAALRSGRPTVVDCYAAWCRPCMMLKHETFTDPRVVAALGSFNRLRADLSFRESEYARAVSKKHRIQGLPTMIFFDEGGREIPRRVWGFMTADQFLEFLESLKEKKGVPPH
ncbi:MAG TPA: thioredoxin domain-containing protein [Candidatus Omnitrophota bacterium]|jgi:thiol:disulfide interchange protein DsbD|nr:thioredoxin domain-containing protein [Candidatus Omnitrophota bacterium]